MYADQSLYEVVIVGAGPAGISLAAAARERGIKAQHIIVLEKAPDHSWSIRKFYPEEKLVTANYKGQDISCEGALCLMDSTKEQTLNYLDEAIEKYSLHVQYNQNVEEIKKLANGQYVVCSGNECFVTKTVAIAIGVMGRPNRPSYSIPNVISKQVFFDISNDDLKDKSVLVVGGGDSASEYVQYLIQRGNEVSLSYRKEAFSRMNDINSKALYTLHKQGRCKFLLDSNIVSIEKNNNKVKVNFKECDALCYDAIVYALGGTTPTNFLDAIGIKMTKEGPEVSNFFESEEKEGIFLLGDLTAKNGGSINVAFNHSNHAMDELCSMYLDCCTTFSPSKGN